MADNGEVNQNERERMVRELKFLYKGRFNDEEARRIFDHVKWDRERGLKFVSESESSEVRRIIGQSEDTINAIKTDPTIIDLLKNGIKKETRQFACEACDHAWWRKVPMSKEVSKCRKCNKKYDPVPREFEWGWASYDCKCGHEFSGAGQKNTSAPCYKCERSVDPTGIKPFWRRRGRKSDNQHCCDAPDCTGHDPVRIHDVDPDRIYDDGTDNSRPVKFSRPVELDDVTGQVENLHVRNESVRNVNLQRNPITPRRQSGISTCVSPESRVNKKKVVYPSEPHISTGSTIATFLSQSEIASSYFPSLASIPEHQGRGGRGRGRGGRRY
ncbi:shiftless antiviral inhibitor of ribosomal frameshifting protein homolog [Mytilus californianus]|uniref:shiftless antiviral inhibitor of ribosomal frameshifting protein homolog n=1 Tax=Mytilus californianus TaxID=6549 RepID=UPI0022470435|nr:shiftless antiviral inhibitor of ribosomal frameshifting protein homolog [Mytilus californianus]